MITISPGRRSGTRNCSTQARKLSPSMGPSNTHGAMMPSQRRPATKVNVEGQCLAMTVRHLRDQSLASGTASVQSGHVRLRPGFIDEDQPSGGDLVLVLLPLPPPARDVGAILFAGVQAFF